MVTKMPKYEYKTVPMPQYLNEFDDELNALAKEMWEPITAFSPNNMQEFSFNPRGKMASTFVIFKRQLG